MTRVAVIGGGAAGIAAARVLLHAGAEVALFEAAPAIGGNCIGLDVRGAGGARHTIDVGVSDFNRHTFSECVALFAELGLETRPIGTDASFADAEGRTLASCRAGRWRLASGSADSDRFAVEVEAFCRRATEVLDDARCATWSLGRYLDHVGASAALRELYVLPRAMGCFPAPDGPPAAMPVRDVVEFWRMHGVVGALPGQRHCVVGGMHRYPGAFARWFAGHGGELQCGARVLGVVRRRDRVELRWVDGDDRHRRQAFEHVLFAMHARETLALLEQPTAAEVTALAGFGRQRARVVVHCDPRLVGDDRTSWGAYHYVVPAGAPVRVRPTITFFPKRLMGLPDAAPDAFVTLNPHREPDPDRVLGERFFVHPTWARRQRRSVAEVEALQGRRRTWFAGSHLVAPFVHECALRSGRGAAERLLAGARRLPRGALSGVGR